MDRAKLFRAVRALLKTPNGDGARSTASVFDKLTLGEVLELADAIVDGAMIPAPGNSMGGNAIRGSQAVLAKHMFEEALPISMTYGFASCPVLIEDASLACR